MIGDHFEVPADIRVALQKKGHILQSLSSGTICQFIVQDVGTSKKNGGIGKLVAVSDPRKGGFPAGYWNAVVILGISWYAGVVLGNSIKFVSFISAAGRWFFFQFGEIVSYCKRGDRYNFSVLNQDWK